MKRWIYLLIPVIVTLNFVSCCQCMKCPGSGQYTGTGNDTICKEAYEAQNPTMSWAQYSDYMLQTGCTCVK